MSNNAESPTASGAAQLLICPFCGELPTYEPKLQGPEPHLYWPHQIVHNCKVLDQQLCVRAHTVGLPDTKESVFSIWNTRLTRQPNDPSSPATVGAERKHEQ